jgi:DNA repair photolyase
VSDTPRNLASSSGQPPAKGRGAGVNPVNRFETLSLHVLPEHIEHITADPDEPDRPPVTTAVYSDRSRTIINPVDSPDLGMEWTVNPYRGCEHGCVYCYARPGHEYLGLSSGLDFETKIIAKRDAAALLRAEFMKPSWKGRTIALSGVTDPYQPVEAKLRITRAILEVCAEFRQPVTIVTKNRLVTRDIDLLADLARDGAAAVAVSLTTLDPALSRIMEPRASAPAARLAAMRALADAGVPVRVMTAPIIPGINDREVPALLGAAAGAGATGAGYVLVRLPYQNKAIFVEWLERHFPDRAARVQSLLKQCHDGRLYSADFGTRQRGTGPVAKMIADTFRVFAAREGLLPRGRTLTPEEFEDEVATHQSVVQRRRPTPFRRPQPPREPSLFDPV